MLFKDSHRLFNGLIIAIMLAGIVSFWSCAIRQEAEKDQVCFKNNCFDVEIVSSPEEIQRGLMFRKSLSPNKGMLFVFPDNTIHHFWMKNTLIPLDMIWLDTTKNVLHVEHNVPPCQTDPCPSYGHNQSSMYVLEINAGESARRPIKVGDSAEFNL